MRESLYLSYFICVCPIVGPSEDGAEFHYYWKWPLVYSFLKKIDIFSRKLHIIFSIVCTFMLHNLHRWFIDCGFVPYRQYTSHVTADLHRTYIPH